jgi:hypothetical protein
MMDERQYALFVNGIFMPEPQVLPTPTQPATNPYPTQAERKVLEDKAKKLIKSMGGTRKSSSDPQLPKRSPMMAGVIVLLLLVLGGGGFAGMQLLNRDQSADIGSQAAWTTECNSADDVGKLSCNSFTVQAYCEAANTACLPGWSGGTYGYPHWCTRSCNTGQYCQSGTGLCVNNPEPTTIQPTSTSAPGKPTSTPVPTPKRYCTSTGCNVGSEFNQTCYVNYYFCRTYSPQGCSATNADVTKYGLQSASIEQDCGTEQIDVTDGCKYDFYPGAPYADFTSSDTNKDCSGTSPTKTPTPVKSPTPTVTPVLACTTLGFSNNNPNYGDTVTLTCTGTPNTSVNYAYFQYSVDGAAYQNINNVTSVTAQLTINRVGTYNVRCRVCGSSTDLATCTGWQTAGVN